MLRAIVPALWAPEFAEVAKETVGLGEGYFKE